MTNPFIAELNQQSGNPFLEELNKPSVPPKVASPPDKKEEDQPGMLDRFLTGMGQGIKDVASAIASPGAAGPGVYRPTITYSQIDKEKQDYALRKAIQGDLGTAGAVGKFAGNMVAQAPFMAAVGPTIAAELNPLTTKVAGKGITSAAEFLAPKIAKVGLNSTALQHAIEAGITSIPAEVISGTVTEGLTHPDSFQDVKSGLRVAAWSSVGGLFNAGFAYRDAIKAAKSLAELATIKTQIEEITSPPVEAAPLPPQNPNLPSAVDVAQNRTFPATDPAFGQLPTAQQAAMKRLQQSLDEQIQQRAVALSTRDPIVDKDVFGKRLEKAAAKQQPDPLVAAQMRGVEDRLKQVQDRALLTKAQEGKGIQTPPGVDLGVRLDPKDFLTVDELQHYLQTLNMGSLHSAPSFKAGQELSPYRGDLESAGILSAARTGGVFPEIDPFIQETQKYVQNTLDWHASNGRKFLDVDEVQPLVNDMLAMSRRLGRGFEVPYKENLPLPGKPSKSVLYNPDGLDLPTTAKLEDPNIAAHILDDSHKRWVTGSDDVPPPPPAQAQAQAESYADAVRGMNIDYTSKSKNLFQNLWDWAKDARTNLFDRTEGVGKYSRESGDLLSMLSGTTRAADDFYNVEMRIAKVDPDGVWRGQTQVISGRPLGKIVDPLSVDQIKEVDAALKAQTLIARKQANPDFKLDVDLDRANAVLAGAPDYVKSIMAEFKVVSDALVDDAVALGRLGTDRGADMKSTFYAGLSRSFNNQMTQNSLARALGSTRASLSPVMLMRDNIFKMMEKSRKNYSLSRLVEAYHANPEGFKDIIEPIPKKGTPNFDAVYNKAIEEGMTHVEATDYATMTAPSFDHSDGSLVVYKGGQPTFWKVNNDIRKTMTSLSPLEFGVWRSALAAASSLTRKGTSLALDLSGIGPAMDATLTTAFTPKFVPIYDNIRGAVHTLLKTDKYLERNAALGAFGGRFEPAEAVVFKSKSASAVDVGSKLLLKPLEITQAIIRPLSEASRMAEYLVRTERLGQTALEAALGSRRTLGDFNRVGASLRPWALMTEFGNVGFQTADAAYAGLKMVKDELAKGNLAPATRLLSTGIGAITLPTLYFRALSQDDPALEARRKSDVGYRYHWFRAPIDIPGVAEKGDILKYPKLGWWMGQAFGSTVEAALDGMDEDARRRLYDGLWSQVGLNPLPLKLQQAIGLMKNTRNPLSFENNIPITPGSQVGLDPSVQGNDRTSPLARTLANKAGINPFLTDFMAEVVGGQLLSSTVRQLGSSSVKLDKTDLPVVGRFFTKSGASTEGQSLFYRDIDEAKNAESSIQRALKAGDPDKARAIIAESGRIAQVKSDLEKYGTRISDMNKLANTITLDPNFSPETKRTYLNNLRNAQEEIFRAYAQMHPMIKH